MLDEQLEDAENRPIKHKKGHNFTDEFANGALIVGPTSDNLYFLTFYSDCADVKQERLRVSSEESHEAGQTIYETYIDSPDIEPYREDKVRITLSKDTLMRIKGLLNLQLPD